MCRGLKGREEVVKETFLEGFGGSSAAQPKAGELKKEFHQRQIHQTPSILFFRSPETPGPNMRIYENLYRMGSKGVSKGDLPVTFLQVVTGKKSRGYYRMEFSV